MAATLQSETTNSYNSFSGCDIHATFGGVRIGEIQGASFTIMREKAPVYTMGNPDPRGFSRGKRGIAGSLVFVMFDRSSLLEGLKGRGRATFVTNLDQLSQNRRRHGALPGNTSWLNGSDPYTSIGTGVSLPAVAWYPDQIPPFDIVLNAINEYGHRASMSVHGVEILNSGSGISIDDISIDESMTFVATSIDPWKPERFFPPGAVNGKDTRLQSSW